MEKNLLGIKATEEEVLIRKRLDVRCMLADRMIATFPTTEISAENYEKYLSVALKLQAEAHSCRMEWWQALGEKYDLTKVDAMIDENGEFFTLKG